MLDPALTQTETSSLIHFDKARDVQPCHCASYSVMSPDANTFLVVWKFEDLHHLGGTPPDRTVIPYVLSADMALLHLVKHGPKPPVEADLKDLFGKNCSLEEAFLIVIGLAPSLQTKFRRTTLFSHTRAHMLREVYLVVEQFKAQYQETFERMTMNVPLRAYHRLMKVRFDPLTRSVRPHGAEEDPYLGMNADLHEEIMVQLYCTRLPRLIHRHCTHSPKGAEPRISNIPEDPRLGWSQRRNEEAAALQQVMARKQAYLDQVRPGEHALSARISKEEIPAYNAKVFGEGFVTFPVIDFKEEEIPADVAMPQQPGSSSASKDTISPLPAVSLRPFPSLFPFDNLI